MGCQPASLNWDRLPEYQLPQPDPVERVRWRRHVTVRDGGIKLCEMAADEAVVAGNWLNASALVLAWLVYLERISDSRLAMVEALGPPSDFLAMGQTWLR